MGLRCTRRSRELQYYHIEDMLGHTSHQLRKLATLGIWLYDVPQLGLATLFVPLDHVLSQIPKEDIYSPFSKERQNRDLKWHGIYRAHGTYLQGKRTIE